MIIQIMLIAAEGRGPFGLCSRASLGGMTTSLEGSKGAPSNGGRK